MAHYRKGLGYCKTVKEEYTQGFFVEASGYPRAEGLTPYEGRSPRVITIPCKDISGVNMLVKALNLNGVTALGLQQVKGNMVEVAGWDKDKLEVYKP